MPAGVSPKLEESLRPDVVQTEAVTLLGNEDLGMVAEVEEVIDRMHKKPTRNVATALSVLEMADEQAYLLDELERGHRTQVNLLALEKLYTRYGITDSRVEVEPSQDELWLTLTHQTDRGFRFREIWGYFPEHTKGDFAPDILTVLVEAIRRPDSDSLHYRELQSQTVAADK